MGFASQDIGIGSRGVMRPRWLAMLGTGLLLGTMPASVLAAGAASARGLMAVPAMQGAGANRPRIEERVTGGKPAQGGFFGYAAAASGNTLVISEPGARVGGNVHQGAVYVFENSNGTWSKTRTLIASDGRSGDGFGISVSVDGNEMIVGASHKDKGRGDAYAFTRSGGSWREVQKLTASDGFPGQGFGHSVAVSGATAVIGAPGDKSFQGAAYVFTRRHGTWHEVQKLSARDGAMRDYFADSVAVSGKTILVGASICRSFRSREGSVYVFTESGGTWSQTQKLAARDGGPGNCFGYVMALSGFTALIGAQGAGGASGDGAAYVFDESHGHWSQVQKLTGDARIGPESFGSGVALSRSGATAVVGASTAAVGSNPATGAAYLFTRSNGAWRRGPMFTTEGPVPGELLGFAVALSGRTAVATTVPDYSGGPGPDAAYLYRLPRSPADDITMDWVPTADTPLPASSAFRRLQFRCRHPDQSAPFPLCANAALYFESPVRSAGHGSRRRH